MAFYDGQYHTWQTPSLDLTEIYNICSFMHNKGQLKIGYEDFKHRPQIGVGELYSVQVIGVIRLWIQKHYEPEPFKWLPATCKAFWKDNTIKALGLWEPGNIHAMDALRVLLKYRSETEPEWYANTLRTIHGKTRP